MSNNIKTSAWYEKPDAGRKDLVELNVYVLLSSEQIRNNDRIIEYGYVKLIDLVKFEDWRNVWKNNYYAYYNIQKIEVIGAASGANIAEFVLTNLNQANAETFVPLSDVTNNIELAYAPVEVTSGQSNTSDYGTITYTNHGNTVDDFMIKVPVVVTYEWGKVYTTVDLKVNGTIGGNSAKPAL